MNLIAIKGRLTRDPELKTVTVKGEDKTVCNFAVAVDRSFGEGADFFNCQIWGKRAMVIDKFFSKGKEIVVQGEMRCRPYEDKQGNKRQAWEVAVGQFDFCGKKSDDTSAGDIPDGFVQVDDDDDDIPF